MMCGYVIRRRLLIAELELDTQRWTSTLLQVKFLTPTVKAEYFARAPTEAVAKLKTELSQGRAHSGSHVYHDMAAHELARFGFRGEIRVLAPRSTKAGRVAFLQLAPCPVRCFVNTEHLMRLVAKDLKHGKLHMRACTSRWH